MKFDNVHCHSHALKAAALYSERANYLSQKDFSYHSHCTICQLNESLSYLHGYTCSHKPHSWLAQALLASYEPPFNITYLTGPSLSPRTSCWTIHWWVNLYSIHNNYSYLVCKCLVWGFVLATPSDSFVYTVTNTEMPHLFVTLPYGFCWQWAQSCG